MILVKQFVLLNIFILIALGDREKCSEKAVRDDIAQPPEHDPSDDAQQPQNSLHDVFVFRFYVANAFF